MGTGKITQAKVTESVGVTKALERNIVSQKFCNLKKVAIPFMRSKLHFQYVLNQGAGQPIISHMTRLALVDCNNFYCSCERVFHPALLGKPIVALSNNDGCIISRSEEAKAWHPHG